MGEARIVTIYTVRRSPYTAAAKRSAGYNSPEFEYATDSAQEAITRAVADCPWRDAQRNFSFTVTGSRVVVLEPTDGES